MENQLNGASVLRILFFLLASIGYLYAMYRFEGSPAVRRGIRKYVLPRSLDKEYKQYIEKYFAFYNALKSEDKLLFERRIQRFIDMKQFIPRGVSEITPEMKALIAGSAIQITFGYPDLYFSYFTRILVYADSYYSNITRKYHLGEVNANGFIVLSWKSFKEGFIKPDDGHNLGFHEMAHALRLINIVDNDEYNFYDRSIMDDFESEARKEVLKANSHQTDKSFFRGYYIPNIEEFFSVAVECFFERPLELREYNPQMYRSLTKILKTDPAMLYGQGSQQTMVS